MKQVVKKHDRTPQVLIKDCEPDNGIYVTVIDGCPCILVGQAGFSENYGWVAISAKYISTGTGYNGKNTFSIVIKETENVLQLADHIELAEWLLTVPPREKK